MCVRHGFARGGGSGLNSVANEHDEIPVAFQMRQGRRLDAPALKIFGKGKGADPGKVRAF